MSMQEKILAQHRPSTINAVSIYNPINNSSIIIKTIIVCNTTNSSGTFSIFIDANGTNYNQDTALYYDAAINAKTTILIDSYWPISNSNSNFAVQSSIVEGINFTIMGVAIS